MMHICIQEGDILHNIVNQNIFQRVWRSPRCFHHRSADGTLVKKKKSNLHDFSAAKAVQSLYGSGPTSLEQKGCTVCL